MFVSFSHMIESFNRIKYDCNASNSDESYELMLEAWKSKKEWKNEKKWNRIEGFCLKLIRNKQLTSNINQNETHKNRKKVYFHGYNKIIESYIFVLWYLIDFSVNIDS